MNNNYAKACKEVLEIFKYIPEEYIKKIPLEIIQAMKEKEDKKYEFHYDINKEYDEQNLLIETKAILANIFRDYWATTEEKQKIKDIYNEEIRKIEELKREKYKYEDLFKNKDKKLNYEIQNTQLIEKRKESFIQKIVNKIKKLFIRKK